MRVHPKDPLLEDLVGSLTAEHRKSLEHALGCADCIAKLLSFLRPQQSRSAAQSLSRILEWSPRQVDYTQIITRCARQYDRQWSVFEKERVEARSLLAELGTHPAERQRIILENNERFQTWGLLELLVARGMEESGRNPGQGEELAALAIHLAAHLSHPTYGADLIADLEARAWGAIGNARRVKADLAGSEAAFEQAFARLEQGTGDSFEQAILLDCKASLLRAERRFEEAARLLRRAIATFREIGDLHRAGRSLINLSTVHEHQGSPEEAVPVLYEALDLIRPEEEPQLLLCAWHNLMTNLAEAGRYMEAQGLLAKARPLYQRFPDPCTKSRESWVKGKIARGLGRSEEAEARFLSARDGFLGVDAAYDTALVSLELACLYAAQGRIGELERISEEMLPIFSSRQIHREALAALTFLRQAVLAEQASLEMVTEVAGYLRRAQNDPGLRFEQVHWEVSG
jgi:tetratricopeptide (TPR) repeat protein